MSFLSKILKVATGGLSGPVGSLMHGDVKGAGVGALTGGVFGGRNSQKGPLPLSAVGFLRGMRPAPPVAGAQDYLNSFSPEDQQSIRTSWGTNPNAINDWYNNARAAGAVPAPAPSVAAAPAQTMPQPSQMAQEIAMAKRKFQMGRNLPGVGYMTNRSVE